MYRDISDAVTVAVYVLRTADEGRRGVVSTNVLTSAVLSVCDSCGTGADRRGALG